MFHNRAAGPKSLHTPESQEAGVLRFVMRRGLSRLELIVVIVLGVFALALIIPFALQQRTQSRRLLCERRLARLAIAVQRYDDRHEFFPGYRNLQATDQAGKERSTGWVFPLLPFLEASDEASEELTTIFASYGPEGPVATRGQEPTQFLSEVICPALPMSQYRRDLQPLSYVANCGQPDAEVPADGDIPPDWAANGLFFDHLRSPAQQVKVSLDWLSKHDGAEVTLLFSENLNATRWVSAREAEVGILWVPNEEDGIPSPLPLIEPINQGTTIASVRDMKQARPASLHPGGVNVVMADGKTQFLSEQIDYLAYVRMLTSDGQNVKRAGEDQLLGKPWRDVKSE